MPETEPVAVVSADKQSATGSASVTPHLPIPARHPVNPLPVVSTPETGIALELAFPTSLDQADSYLRERLAQLIPGEKLLKLLNLNYFIQKFVLLVDHLPEKNIPRLHLPLIPPEPGFLMVGTGDERTISPQNAQRYRNYVSLIEAIPDAVLIKLYRGLYPLFQQAYREADHPTGHFNDRLIEAFDDLLLTPEPQGPLKLKRHISRFRFIDVSLEERSAGQKTLLRMGKESTRRVKQKLRGLRKGLARQDW